MCVVNPAGVFTIACRLLDYLDLSVSKFVELVHELVNLPVRGVNLALDGRLDRWCLGRGEPLVQVKHLLSESVDPGRLQQQRCRRRL